MTEPSSGSTEQPEATQQPEPTEQPERITADELRTLFLFERLTEEQLAALVALARVVTVPAGQTLYSEGEPATCFYSLLEGEISMTRRVRDGEVELVRSSSRGVYAGATSAYAGQHVAQVYFNTVRVTRDARLVEFPAKEFADLLREWFPLAIHLLEGLLMGLRNSEALVGQRERLLALGQLSAGLTHELNNPAAAAVRATSALRERVAGMRHKLAILASGDIDPEELQRVVVLQEATVERAAKAPRLSPMEQSDLEDSLADWLDDHDVDGAYDLAGVLAGSGLDPAWAAEVVSAVEDDALEPVLRWLAYTVETEQLMREIEDATTRISTLLAAVKQYSGMDRTPYEHVDLVEGLESTLTMLTHKIGPTTTVVRDYGEDLPTVPGYGAELNQVWTNLIDNAVQAMGGSGTLTVRTRRAEDGERVVVEIGDTGPGVPEDIQSRIFEPFFTTKGVGEGTGLGLDISYRIVVTRHHGDITLDSRPGETWFRVRLPVHEAT